ncbi:hypothetical protein ACX818_001290 [Acinetobacter baumannii]
MASILPENKLLNVIMEGNNSSVAFSPSLSGTEKLVSINIIYHNFPNSITVNGPKFSGVFRDLFELPKDSLKYRKGLEYGTASKFSELPPKGAAQLYSFTPPSQMLKNFNVTVELVYNEGPGTPELNITKEYIQPVQGNWDTFKNQFLEYVR